MPWCGSTGKMSIIYGSANYKDSPLHNFGLVKGDGLVLVFENVSGYADPSASPTAPQTDIIVPPPNHVDLTGSKLAIVANWPDGFENPATATGALYFDSDLTGSDRDAQRAALNAVLSAGGGVFHVAGQLLGGSAVSPIQDRTISLAEDPNGNDGIEINGVGSGNLTSASLRKPKGK